MMSVYCLTYFSFFFIFISYLFIQDDPIQVNIELIDIEYVQQATDITIWDRKKKTSLPK